MNEYGVDDTTNINTPVTNELEEAIFWILLIINAGLMIYLG